MSSRLNNTNFSNEIRYICDFLFNTDADNVGSMSINELYGPNDEAETLFNSSTLPHSLPNNLLHYHPPCYNKYKTILNKIR